ncbi:MAG: tRNA (adenosine(37)-N6)-threonylcarbamoyltransferase complex ATPase subunit type 1 TsaE [Ignavibacteria bacterium RBG_13_36_8]|nr:MAG: tRNA (adenosine(37)-N6)-threonylcarbamoyltransferase complex ATPase subunit type 1 TsaE [Ignavibacteria bacterium RBG_13_36_8]
MKFPKKVLFESEQDTARFAELFSEIIKEGDVIALNGNLGSGKTFFVKNVCKQYLINNVTSPSFAIVNEYKGEYKVYHFDFYRIKKIVELYDIGIEDYLNDEDAIVFVEWAERMPSILPNNRYEICFKFVNEHSREIFINKI